MAIWNCAATPIQKPISSNPESSTVPDGSTSKEEETTSTEEIPSSEVEAVKPQTNNEETKQTQPKNAYTFLIVIAALAVYLAVGGGTFILLKKFKK